MTDDPKFPPTNGISLDEAAEWEPITPQTPPATPSPDIQPVNIEPPIQNQPETHKASLQNVDSTSSPVAQTNTVQDLAAEPTADNETHAEQDPASETTIPEDVFLLRPENKPILETDQRQRRLRLPGGRIVLALLMLPVIGGFLVANTAATHWFALLPINDLSTVPTDDILRTLRWTGWALLVNIITLGMFLSGLSVFLQHRALEKRGALAVGQVRTANGRIDRWGNVEITVEYRFRTPRRFAWDVPVPVEGKRTVDRNDLRDKPLPAPGTPIAVLFLKRDNYVVL